MLIAPEVFGRRDDHLCCLSRHAVIDHERCLSTAASQRAGLGRPDGIVGAIKHDRTMTEEPPIAVLADDTAYAEAVQLA
ncbi:hypothetical protein [Streptosporangium amethystogenes]|uniref:hypothetical protein n=1 Tax=Streptosporangium amethystogenes TaxID=2002 RepID=UPI001FDF6971|nr:hypothetical protein [Streptosporangium amethystogenes]